MQRAGLRVSLPRHAHSKKMCMRTEGIPMHSGNTFLLPPEDTSDLISRSGAESGRNARNSCGKYDLATASAALQYPTGRRRMKGLGWGQTHGGGPYQN